MKNKEVINHLTETNDYTYNLLKASEELSELSLVLLQLVNKPNKVDVQEVIDEIGDVKIRMKILSKLFNKEEIKKRYNFKLRKFNSYIEEGKYKGGI
jgi:hypothetical protein